MREIGRLQIVPVQIDGIPSADEGSAKEAKPEIVKEKGHIMVRKRQL